MLRGVLKALHLTFHEHGAELCLWWCRFWGKWVQMHLRSKEPLLECTVLKRPAGFLQCACILRYFVTPCAWILVRLCVSACVCVREREWEGQRGKKSNVFHSKIRAFLSSSIIVQFFLRGASIYYCLPKGQQSHTHTRAHTDRSVSHSRTWHWVGGGEVERRRGRERDESRFLFSSAAHTMGKRGLCKKKKNALYLSLSLSIALLFSSSLNKITIIINSHYEAGCWKGLSLSTQSEKRQL